jgi:hypothetical protein
MGGVQCCATERPSAKAAAGISVNMEMRKRAWAVLQAYKDAERCSITKMAMGDKVEIMRGAVWRPATVLRTTKGFDNVQVRWDDSFRLEWVRPTLENIRMDKNQ